MEDSASRAREPQRSDSISLLEHASRRSLIVDCHVPELLLPQENIAQVAESTIGLDGLNGGSDGRSGGGSILAGLGTLASTHFPLQPDSALSSSSGFGSAPNDVGHASSPCISPQTTAKSGGGLVTDRPDEAGVRLSGQPEARQFVFEPAQPRPLGVTKASVEAAGCIGAREACRRGLYKVSFGSTLTEYHSSEATICSSSQEHQQRLSSLIQVPHEYQQFFPDTQEPWPSNAPMESQQTCPDDSYVTAFPGSFSFNALLVNDPTFMSPKDRNHLAEFEACGKTIHSPPAESDLHRNPPLL
ncbi:unnamed protein product [Protopolystoma xenopodis]|uniref:Uncharacterized protein n=1 Tax=Protopolystoma xenopodis TaxID=117903 RepID=A0A3S5CST7_9PLAT|nr:unnamed protein product [Protopolystoma xenopodis]